MFRHSLLVILLLFIGANSYAQRGSYVEFKRFDASDLGVNEISFQCWDATGKCWARSEKGLLSYDGYNSKLHLHDPLDENTVLNDTIMRVFQTDSNELWISYETIPVVSKFNPATKSFNHFDLPLLDDEGKFKYQIVKVVKDHLGQVWVLTWGKGLLLLNTDQGTTEQFLFPLPTDTTDQDCFIKELTQVEGDEYIVGFFHSAGSGRNKPLYFNVKDKTFKRIDYTKYLENVDFGVTLDRMELILSIVNFIHVDRNRNFWLGTYSGIIFMDNHNKTLKRVVAEDESINEYNLGNCRVYEEFNEELWIGTTNMGVLRVNMEHKTVQKIQSDPYNPTTLYDNRVVTISKDPLSNIWVCSEEGMISIYIPLTDRFDVHLWETMRLGYANRSAQVIPVNQILVNPDGTVWVSSGTGLQLYNPKLKKVVYHVAIDPANKHDLDNDNIGNFKIIGDTVYCVGSNAFIAYNKQTQRAKIVRQSKNAYSFLFRHSNPEIALHGFRDYRDKGADIVKIDRKTGEYEIEYSFPDDRVKILETFSVELPSGNWLLHEGERNKNYSRFVVYDPINKTHELYSPSSKQYFFPDSAVFIAFRDGNDIWIGSETGLYKFDEKSKKSTNYNKQIGIAEDEPVKGLIKDERGRIWIALAQDLVVWDQKTGETERFGTAVGLNVGSFLPAIGQKDDNDNIYFATINGILVFNPNSIAYSEFRFNMTLDQVTVNNDTLKPELKQQVETGGFQFHWDDDYITFSFHTSHVYGSGEHNILYQLDDLSEDSDTLWMDNGQFNSIKLFNLPHGDYELNVKAVSNFGQESEVYTIPFSVKRPYWLSWWFYAIIIIVLGTIIVAYVKYREKALRKRSEELEQTVAVRTAEVVEQKQEADRQREMVEEKQKEITDSISYAKRIQEAIMPSNDLFKKNLPDSFIIYKPKDIVAGDFYWMEELENGVIFAAADCTGHGVPGAMVSVVCNNALNRSVREFGLTEPAKILDKTRELVIEQFEKGNGNGDGPSIKDGMDISLCYYSKSDSKIQWAGANNPLWLMRNGELEELKGDKQPIGQYHEATPFTSHEKNLQKGDFICIFSDGYADQFGGEKGKKFKTKAFKELLAQVSDRSMQEIQTFIDDSFEEWKGDYEQVDDVCVIGVRF